MWRRFCRICANEEEACKLTHNDHSRKRKHTGTHLRRTQFVKIFVGRTRTEAANVEIGSTELLTVGAIRLVARTVLIVSIAVRIQAVAIRGGRRAVRLLTDHAAGAGAVIGAHHEVAA